MYAVISRVLRRRHEPRSIFEHIDGHVRPDTRGLAEGGEILPDEALVTHGASDVAPGGVEGMIESIAASEDDRAAIEQIYDALAALAAKPTSATRARLRELFRDGRVRSRIDGLRDRLSAESPANAGELYPELREILLTSGRRDEVKYAMALLAGFGRREDAQLFRILGRHEEFTLYAAVALAGVSDDPLQEWLDLLGQVGGWGRTELSELILREPRSEIVRERVLRAGLGVENALALAVGCRLDELLGREQVDDELLARAREIVDALVWRADSPSTLTDYPGAGAAVEGLLRQIGLRPRGLAELVTVLELRRLLTAAERDDIDRLATCGFDAERLAWVVAVCTAMIDGGDWLPQISQALRSDDGEERSLGLAAAQRLGLEP
jgi:hypothetical protein